MKIVDMIIVTISVHRKVSQTPSSPRKIGRTITKPHSKMITLENEMIAEITPLFSAVNNDDEKILYPHNTKAIT